MKPRAPWLHSLGPLVLADLKRRYAGSVLGALWAGLVPILEAVTYGVVFGVLLGLRGPSRIPYAVLIASGLFPWAAFREAVEGSASVLPDHRWIRRSRVPMELLVARLVLGAAPRALVGLLMVLGAAFVVGARPGVAGLLSPFAALAFQLLAAYGLGLIAAPLATLLPDLRPALVSVLTLLTFASPILYPAVLAHGVWATVLAVNPFTHLLSLYRDPMEPLAWGARLVSLGVGLGTALLLLGLGMASRRRLWWKARDLL
jgi:ABC-type polysaccharide/polyol phosphate export permease